MIIHLFYLIRSIYFVDARTGLLLNASGDKLFLGKNLDHFYLEDTKNITVKNIRHLYKFITKTIDNKAKLKKKRKIFKWDQKMKLVASGLNRYVVRRGDWCLVQKDKSSKLKFKFCKFNKPVEFKLCKTPDCSRRYRVYHRKNKYRRHHKNIIGNSDDYYSNRMYGKNYKMHNRHFHNMNRYLNKNRYSDIRHDCKFNCTKPVRFDKFYSGRFDDIDSCNVKTLGNNYSPNSFGNNDAYRHPKYKIDCDEMDEMCLRKKYKNRHRSFNSSECDSFMDSSSYHERFRENLNFKQPKSYTDIFNMLCNTYGMENKRLYNANLF